MSTGIVSNDKPSVQGNPIKAGIKKEKPKDIKYQRDRDREPVRGIFRFYEVPNGCLSFVFRKYKEDPIERFDLIDGQIYTIPLGVAKHLNKNCWYPVHAYQMSDNGKHSVYVGKKVRRCGFQSLEFIDTDELTPVGEGIMMQSVQIS